LSTKVAINVQRLDYTVAVERETNDDVIVVARAPEALALYQVVQKFTMSYVALNGKEQLGPTTLLLRFTVRQRPE
jgi:hypothetical protein